MLSNRPCSCGGWNPACFKCDGTGLLPEEIDKLQRVDYTISGDKAKKEWDKEHEEQARKKKEIKREETAKSSFPQISTKTTRKDSHYQCAVCDYKWNSDPNALCAWCKSLGPYFLHDKERPS